MAPFLETDEAKKSSQQSTTEELDSLILRIKDIEQLIATHTHELPKYPSHFHRDAHISIHTHTHTSIHGHIVLLRYRCAKIGCVWWDMMSSIRDPSDVCELQIVSECVCGCKDTM